MTYCVGAANSTLSTVSSQAGESTTVTMARTWGSDVNNITLYKPTRQNIDYEEKIDTKHLEFSYKRTHTKNLMI